MAKTAEKKPYDHMAWVKTRKVPKQKAHPERTHFTGFCNNAHCEGTRPKNHKGTALKTCPMYLTCVCRCHVEQDEMFESVGMERRIVENPEYRVPPPQYIMPNPLDFKPSEFGSPVKKRGPVDMAAIEGEELTPDRILQGNVFHMTDSGRRVKGQLEYQVLEACNKAMDVWPDELEITPKRIADYIGNKQKTAPPSSGAVDAVWKRWVAMGFAKIGSKPVRFLDYAAKENQTIEQLEAAKMLHKRSTKSAAKAVANSFRKKI